MSKKSLPTEQRKSIEEATAEAEARPLDYDPAARANYVRSMLTDIQSWQAEGVTEDVIRTRCTDFIERYPELFKKIIEKSDLTPIYSMLGMLDHMGEGRINQHNASMVIGKQLVDKFVMPQLKSKDRK
jgi:hypothetical protein